NRGAGRGISVRTTINEYMPPAGPAALRTGERNHDNLYQGSGRKAGRRQTRLGHDDAHAVDAQGQRALRAVPGSAAEEGRVEGQDRAAARTASVHRPGGEE